MKRLKMASLFAGIGGIDLGFKNAGFQPIWANEIDKYCAITFNAPVRKSPPGMVEAIKLYPHYINFYFSR